MDQNTTKIPFAKGGGEDSHGQRCFLARNHSPARVFVASVPVTYTGAFESRADTRAHLSVRSGTEPVLLLVAETPASLLF